MCLCMVVFNFIYYYIETPFMNEVDKIVLSIELHGWYRILMANNIVIISFFSFCIVFLSDIFKRKGWIRQIYLRWPFFAHLSYMYTTSCYLNSNFFHSLVRKIIKLLSYQSSLLDVLLLYDHYDKNIQFTIYYSYIFLIETSQDVSQNRY